MSRSRKNKASRVGDMNNSTTGEIMYVVLQLNTTVEISVMGTEIEVPLLYGDGMIGAMPVFDTKEAAEIFAGDKYQVGELITRAV